MNLTHSDADWWWLWHLARLSNHHDVVKILLRGDLRFLPIVGWGMSFFNFIFLARKWAHDRLRIGLNLQQARSDPGGLFMVIFPEGTVITDETRTRSQKYADKKDLKLPELMLLPKASGTLLCLRSLYPQATHVLDITMGFSGLQAGQWPYDHYPIGKVFFDGKGPKEVHLHIRQFAIKEIPGVVPVTRDAMGVPIVWSESSATTVESHTISESHSSSNCQKHQNGVIDINPNVSTVDRRKGTLPSQPNSSPDVVASPRTITTLTEEDKPQAEFFSDWLRNLYYEKDEMLRQFYVTGGFVPSGERRIIHDTRAGWVDWIVTMIPLIIVWFAWCTIRLLIAFWVS